MSIPVNAKLVPGVRDSLGNLIKLLDSSAVETSGNMSLSDVLTTLSDGAANLTTRINALNLQITNLTNQATALSSQIGNLQTRTSALEVEVTALEGRPALPMGTEGHDEVRYVNNRWRAVSTKSDVYIAFLRNNTFSDLDAVLTAGINSGRGSFKNLSPLGLFRTRRNSSIFLTYANDLAEFWPDGEAAPYYLVITPTYYNWLPHFQVWVSSIVDGTQTNHGPLTFAPNSWTITIDGVGYHVGVYHISDSITRPDDSNTNNGIVVNQGFVSPTANVSVEEVL